MNALENIRHWLCRKTFHFISPKIDYTIKRGDFVTDGSWTLTTLEVVSVNWALSAVALRLGPTGDIVVWPAWCVRKAILLRTS